MHTCLDVLRIILALIETMAYENILPRNLSYEILQFENSQFMIFWPNQACNGIPTIANVCIPVNLRRKDTLYRQYFANCPRLP